MKKILVGCVGYGQPEKVYFTRQIERFTKFRPIVLTWGQASTGSEIPVHEVSSEWESHNTARLRNVMSRLGFKLSYEASRREQAAICAIINQEKPAVLYAHTGFMGMRLLPVKRATNIPLVVHFHGIDVNVRLAAYQRMLTDSIHEFDHAVVVANWMKEHLLKRNYPEEKISVIPMGAPPLDRSDFGSPPEDGAIRFVTVGRLVEYKGFDRVLRAFAKCLHYCPEATLTMVGDGPQMSDLKAIADECKLGTRVEFSGARDPATTLRIVSESHIFLHHALDEPQGPEAFGVVVAEAMALGLPVVGSRCGGVSDQIVDGETGFLVEQNDVDAMARAMRVLYESPEKCAQFGAKGKVRARRYFNSTLLTKQVEAVISQTILGAS